MNPAEMLAWIERLKEEGTASEDSPWGQRYEPATDLYPSPVWAEVAKLPYEETIPYAAGLVWLGGDQALAALLEIAARDENGDRAYEILRCTDHFIAAGDPAFCIGGGAQLGPGPWPITQCIHDALRWAKQIMERDLTYHVGAGTYTMAKTARHTVEMLEEAIEKWSEQERNPGTEEAETKAAD